MGLTPISFNAAMSACENGDGGSTHCSTGCEIVNACETSSSAERHLNVIPYSAATSACDNTMSGINTISFEAAISACENEGV